MSMYWANVINVLACIIIYHINKHMHTHPFMCTHAHTHAHQEPFHQILIFLDCCQNHDSHVKQNITKSSFQIIPQIEQSILENGTYSGTLQSIYHKSHLWKFYPRVPLKTRSLLL